MLRFHRSAKSSRQPRRVVQNNRRVTSTDYYRPKNKPVSTGQVQEKSQAKKLKLTLSSFINYSILLIIVGLLLFSTTLSTAVDVRVNKDDFSYRDTADYAQVAEEIMKSSLANRSKLFFRSSDFEQRMLERFPEVRLIEAILPIAGSRLTASIRVAEPLAYVSSGGLYGVIDSTGVLVSLTRNQNGDLLKLRFASPQSNFSEGARLITTEEVYLLQLISREAALISLKSAETGLSVNEILFNVADGQLEVRFSNVDFFLKLSSYANPDEQIGAAKATLKQLDREDALPTRYLDVRVPGRVFVL